MREAEGRSGEGEVGRGGGGLNSTILVVTLVAAEEEVGYYLI